MFVLFRRLVFAFLSIAVLVVFDTPAFAGTDEAALRIKIAGRQRMLSQRIAKAICSISIIDAEAHSKEAQDAIQLFDWSLRVLHHGGGQGIQKQETHATVTGAIARVGELWNHAGPHFWQLSLGQHDALLNVELIDDNMLLMQRSDELVSEIESTYARRGVSRTGLSTVNHSGRMGMLGEKSVKEACFILQGFRPEENAESLVATIAEISRSLSMLERGDEPLRVTSPPTEPIRLAISDMRRHWREASLILKSVAQDGSLKTEAYQRLHNVMGQFANAADTATVMYSRHFSPAKTGSY
ncbi:MAG: type IV pili methyl-accepting chemotaxis transducer N-terminal domain-containing protein [Pseudomonadota bacterium]